jgi:hypothetical protein
MLSAAHHGIPIITILIYKIDDPTPDIQILIPARIATEVSKIYTDDLKYDGTGSLDRKLEIFIDICKRIGLSSEEIIRAFPIILKKLALDQYYGHKLGDRTYAQACKYLSGFFEGEQSYRSNLNE